MKRHFIAVSLGLTLSALVGAKYYAEKVIPASTTRRPSSLPENEVGYKGKALKQFSFGFDNLLSSLIWVEVLQKANVTPVEKGKLSWEFMQLDSMTELDPAFERSFSFGAPFISTLRRDALGGKIILQKWVKRRPDYWRTHYNLGVHLFQEFHDYAAAAPLILKASQLPRAPQWLTSLGVRLLSESGSYLHALKTATLVYNDIRDSEGKYRLKLRVRSLNFHIQRAAWEESLKKYVEKRKSAPRSIEDLRPEMRSNAREIASVIGDEKIPDDLIPILRETFAFHYDRNGKTIESDIPMEELGIERAGIFHETRS